MWQFLCGSFEQLDTGLNFVRSCWSVSLCAVTQGDSVPGIKTSTSPFIGGTAQWICITLLAADSIKSSTGSTTCRVATLYIRPLTNNESRPLSHQLTTCPSKNDNVRFEEIPKFGGIECSTHDHQFQWLDLDFLSIYADTLPALV
jgi:hypothetical protein